HAEYSYDYRDRRITKRVDYKAPLETVDSPIITVYVDKYFEVREYESPTKYVWNRDTRVAKVTGSLSANPRVQRWRAYPGWNLLGMAVSASNSVAQLGVGSNPAIQAGFKWNPSSNDYSPMTSGDLSSGSVFWLRIATGSLCKLLAPTTTPQL